MPVKCRCGATLKTELDLQLHRCPMDLLDVAVRLEAPRIPRRPIVSSRARPRTPFWRPAP